MNTGRSKRLGISAGGRVLLAVYTIRKVGHEQETIRIISTRKVRKAKWPARGGQASSSRRVQRTLLESAKRTAAVHEMQQQIPRRPDRSHRASLGMTAKSEAEPFDSAQDKQAPPLQTAKMPIKTRRRRRRLGQSLVALLGADCVRCRHGRSGMHICPRTSCDRGCLPENAGRHWRHLQGQWQAR